MKIRSIENAQPLAHIAQPNPFHIHVRKLFFRNPYAVVFNLDAQAAIAADGAQFDFSAADFRRKPVLQAIFDNRLEQHAGHERFQRGFVDLFHNFQVFAAEAGHFDVQVVVDELQFLAKRYKRFVLAQQPPKDIAQLEHHPAGRVRIKTDQRRYGVQRIEKKMGLELRL